jgi:hypothetical protein
MPSTILEIAHEKKERKKLELRLSTKAKARGKKARKKIEGFRSTKKENYFLISISKKQKTMNTASSPCRHSLCSRLLPIRELDDFFKL